MSLQSLNGRHVPKVRQGEQAYPDQILQLINLTKSAGCGPNELSRSHLCCPSEQELLDLMHDGLEPRHVAAEGGDAVPSLSNLTQW
jgi:hypothetical protein